MARFQVLALIKATRLSRRNGFKIYREQACQRQIEMSYSLPNRNVLFGGLARGGRVRVTVDRTGVAPGAVSQGRREGAGSAVIGNPNPLLFGPEGFVFSIIAVKLPSRGFG